VTVEEVVKMSDNEELVTVSGNVFADLGLPNPEERKFKSELAIIIEMVIDNLGITQTEAATRMSMKQSDVSNIVRGRLKGYTVDRLLRALVSLGQNIELSIMPNQADEPAKINIQYGNHRDLAAA
jgi:predicted XRE-type DNA-binding protein